MDLLNDFVAKDSSGLKRWGVIYILVIVVLSIGYNY
jgi:hypothetical protein